MTSGAGKKPALTEQQAELLGGSFTAYAGYFRDFTRQNFSHLNLVMVDQDDPNRFENMREGVMSVFQRQENQQRLGHLTYTEAEQLFGGYSDYLVGRLKNRSEKATTSLPGVQVAGTYILHYPPAEIEAAGAKVAPILIDNQSCKSCKSPPTILHCDDGRPKETKALITAGLEQMERFSVGFHELGHAIANNDVSYLGYVFANLVSSKNATNRHESIADSFSALMMIREFGDLGHGYVRISNSPVAPAGSHATFRAVNATLAWVDENPDALQSMTPAELFKLAARIGDQHALTTAEMKQADQYLKTYNTSTNLNKDTVLERALTGMAHLANGQPMPPGYSEMALEIDTLYLDYIKQLTPDVRAFHDLLAESSMCMAVSPLVDTSALAVTDEDTPTPEQRREQGLLLPPKM